MKHLVMRKPMYQYKGVKSVGIAVDKCQGNEMIELEFTITNCNVGVREFPNWYYLPAFIARNYPIETFNGTPPLYVIPLSVFEQRPPNYGGKNG